MSILDFCEIAKPYKRTKFESGKNLDDFEKFAQEFFRIIHGAKFIEQATRGADGGRDLLFEINPGTGKEVWMVSCKHTAHDGNAVGDIEKDISDRFRISGANVFVGFYSHIMTNALQNKLGGLANNIPNFKYQVFNSAQIESELLSASDGRGWFLASRYFPKSFARLFQSFLHPIAHYKAEHIIDKSAGQIALGKP